MKPKCEKTYKEVVKSKETDGWFDTHVLEPISFVFTKLFYRLDWHPNFISILSGIVGVLGAVCFALDSLLFNLLGVLLEFLCAILDDCDGQLARLTGKMSKLGRFLDGACDSIVFIAVYTSISLRMGNQVIPFTDGITFSYWSWVIVAFVGIFFHADQCKMADYFRNIHLYFLNPNGGHELDRTEDLKKTLKDSKGFGKFANYWYYGYTKTQELRVKNTNKLLSNIAASGSMNEDLQKDYLTESRKYVKFTGWLTYNIRAIALWIALPLHLDIYYLAFVSIVMTAVLVYMRLSYEKAAKQMNLKYFKD